MKTPNMKIVCTVLVFAAIQLNAQTTATKVSQSTGKNDVVAVAGNTFATSPTQYSYNGFDHFNAEDLKSKEVSRELNVPRGGEIYLESNTRSVVVKTWDQPKVKVVTTVYFEGESKLTDEEWFEKMDISLKVLGNAVKIKAATQNFGFGYFVENRVAGTLSAAPSPGSGKREVIGHPIQGSITSVSSVAKKRSMTIYVPAGSKMDIETKYSDIDLPATLGEVMLDISNGNLQAGNLSKLGLRSKYSNAEIGDVKEAEIEFSNGRFTAQSIDNLDIDSKYSTIELASAKKITLRSTNDEFEVEDVQEINGTKNYGNLRITRLNGSLGIDGNNADIKIRNLGNNVSLVKVDNRYADIRIPLRNTKNYAINFTGPFSSVFGDFEKKPVVTEKNGATNEVAGTIKKANEGELSEVRANNVVNGSGSYSLTTYSNTSNSPSKFTAVVGDGKGLKIDMKCHNCTVDFK